MSGLLHRFWMDRSGGPAAEFALVVPLLILFLFGIIDVGRLMWTWNQAEKATQQGVRFAAVTDMIPSGLRTYSFALTGTVPQGDVVPDTSFPGVRCDNAACVCLATRQNQTCAFPLTRDATAFNADVTITYAWSGLGFSGDPNGPDVSPLITVSLRNLTFQPLVLMGLEVDLPAFSATLTMEDGLGLTSN
mgnify:CR=1 FL=1